MGHDERSLRLWARFAHSEEYVAERDRVVERAVARGLWDASHALQSEEKVIEIVMALVGASGERYADPRRIVGALKGVHAERGWLWPQVSGRLELVLKGLEKARGEIAVLERASGAKVDRPRRKPVSAAMLRSWVDLHPLRADDTFVRNTALLLVGFRALLRGKELRDLRLEDVVFEGAGRCVVIKRLHKTDTTGRSQIRVTMDAATNDKACPVRALQRWLGSRVLWAAAQQESRSGVFRDEHFVFPALEGARAGGQLSEDAVSKIVKELASRTCGSSEGFSGHCLRIGGATAMLLAGKSDSEIMLVGGWTSDAFRRYLHGEALVAEGLTAAMLAV